MHSCARRLVRAAILFASVVLPCGSVSNRAHAQFGFGWGFGGMGGGQIGNYMAQRNINQRSAAAANYAYSIRQSIPGSGNVYANNPNAFSNRMRDNTSFNQTYDVSTRRDATASAARGSARRSATNNSPAPAAASAVVSLRQFFSAMGKLVWPQDAPVTGNLQVKQELASESASAVLQQVNAQGFAPVGMVTDARAKLIDYGTPALDYLSQHLSAAAVDPFHQFLLSLYDALGAAGTATH